MTVEVTTAGHPPSRRAVHRSLWAALAALIFTVAVLGGAWYRFATHEGGPLAVHHPYSGQINAWGPGRTGAVVSYTVSLTNDSTAPVTITSVRPLGLGAGLASAGAVVSRAPMNDVGFTSAAFPPGGSALYRPAVGAVVPPTPTVNTSPTLSLVMGIRLNRPGNWPLHGLRVTYTAGGRHFAADLAGIGGVVYCVGQPRCPTPFPFAPS
jgi:hypothetical protein